MVNPILNSKFRTLKLDGRLAKLKNSVSKHSKTRVSKFSGNMVIKGFSKFSESEIKSDLDMKIPMQVEIQILKEGPNRDGILPRNEMEESLICWGDIEIIDFHDESDRATVHKMSDVKGYAIGEPRIDIIDNEAWIIVPAEILNRDLAYQLYLREKRGKPLQVSAEYGWTKYLTMDGPVQTNINPHLISIVRDGHIKGNKISIKKAS